VSYLRIFNTLSLKLLQIIFPQWLPKCWWVIKGEKVDSILKLFSNSWHISCHEWCFIKSMNFVKTVLPFWIMLLDYMHVTNFVICLKQWQDNWFFTLHQSTKNINIFKLSILSTFYDQLFGQYSIAKANCNYRKAVQYTFAQESCSQNVGEIDTWAVERTKKMKLLFVAVFAYSTIFCRLVITSKMLWLCCE